jgi:hypothetical protein
MFQPKLARWLAVLPTLLALNAPAQTATAPAAPPDAQAQAMPAPYRSALEGYQPYSEEKLVPWKQANDTVGKVGGWRAYAKEAAEGRAPDGKAATTGVAPKPPASQAKP